MTLKDGLSYFPKDNDHAKVLILGTFPSEKSLDAEEYYKNPKNKFWSMLETVLNEPGLKDSSYTYKESILREYGIILWDSIAKCERIGSSDKNIVEDTAEPNDIINEFFKENKKNIKIIIINGKTERDNNDKLGAKGWFEKFYNKIGIFASQYKVKVVCLNSTASRGNFKINEWEKSIRPYTLKQVKQNDNKPKIFVIKKNKVELPQNQ